MSALTKAQLSAVVVERDARIAQLLRDIEAMRLRVSIAERNAPVRVPHQLPMHFELARAKAIASGKSVRISNI